MKRSILILLLVLGATSSHAGNRTFFEGARGDSLNLPAHNNIIVTRNDSIPNSVILFKQINLKNVNSISDEELFHDAFSFYYQLLKKYKFKDIGRSSISYVIYDGKSQSVVGPNFYTLNISDLIKLNNRGFDPFDLDKSKNKEIIPAREIIKRMVVIDNSSGSFSINQDKTNALRSSLDKYEFSGGIESAVENNYRSKVVEVSVSGITPHDGNNRRKQKTYTAHCTDGSYGIVDEDDGMICASSNSKSAKCTRNWSISLAASYICQ